MDKKTEALEKISQLGPLVGINVPIVDSNSPAFVLLDEAGVLPYLARRYNRERAQALFTDATGMSPGWSRGFLVGQTGYYLRADIVGRTGAGRVCKALIDRIKVLDSELAQACQEGLLKDGSDGLFGVLDSHLRRSQLAQLAQVDYSRKNYGRAM